MVRLLARLAVLLALFLAACTSPNRYSRPPRTAWDWAQERGDDVAYEEFLEANPDSEHAPEARARVLEIREPRRREAAERVGTRDAYENYLADYPETEFAATAFAELARLDAEEAWAAAVELDTDFGYIDFLERFPEAANAPDAHAALERLAADEAVAVVREADTLAAWEDFVREFPRNEHRAEAGVRIEELGSDPIVTRARERIQAYYEDPLPDRPFFIVEMQLAEPGEPDSLLVKDEDHTYLRVTSDEAYPDDAAFDQPVLRYSQPLEMIVMRLTLETLLLEKEKLDKLFQRITYTLAVVHMDLDFMDTSFITMLPRDEAAFHMPDGGFSTRKGLMTNMLTSGQLASVLPRLPEPERLWVLGKLKEESWIAEDSRGRAYLAMCTERWHEVAEPWAEPHLREVLAEGQPELRIEAAHTLALLDPSGRIFDDLDDEALAAVVDALEREPELGARFEGRQARTAAEEAMERLLEAFWSDGEPARYAALELHHLGWEPADAAEAVRELALTDRWADVAALGEEALEPLLAILGGEPAEWREPAGEVLVTLAEELGHLERADRLIESSTTARAAILNWERPPERILALFAPENQAFLRASGSLEDMRAFGETTSDPKWSAVATAWLEDAEGRSLQALMEEGAVAVRATGSGIEYVRVSFENLTDHPVRVLVPAGLYFASSGRVQNMVSTGGLDLTLEAGRTQSRSISAACANIALPVPGRDSSFDVRRVTEGSELAAVLATLDAGSHFYPVRQAAVWVVTDDASYSGLGKLVQGPVGGGQSRVIHEGVAAEALRVLDEAGIDFRKKRLWQDRAQLLRGLGEGELRTWLEGEL